MHKCSLCSKIYIRRASYINHIEVCKGLGPLKDNQQECPYCKKRYVHKTKFSKHINLHINKRINDDGRFYCLDDSCDITYHCYNSLDMHMWVIHNKDEKREYMNMILKNKLINEQEANRETSREDN